MESAARATETIASRGAAGCRGYQEDGLPRLEAPGGGLAGCDKPPFLLPLENSSICISEKSALIEVSVTAFILQAIHSCVLNGQLHLHSCERGGNQ